MTEQDADIAAILGIGTVSEASLLSSASWPQPRSDGPTRVRLARLALSGNLKRSGGGSSDFWLLFLVLAGQLYVSEGTTLHAGDIGLIKAAGPFEAQADNVQILCLLIRQDEPPQQFPGEVEPIISLKRSELATKVLADWIRILFDNVGDLDADDAVSALLAITRVAARSLQQNFDQSAADGRGIDAAAVAQSYVDANIGDQTLSPDKISAGTRLSRSRLYQIFDADGGVEAYIIRRRLEFCLLDIMQLPAATRGVGRIAAKYGFKSDAHFNRVFRKRFSASPGAFIGVGAASYLSVVADATTRKTTVGAFATVGSSSAHSAFRQVNRDGKDVK